MRFCLNSNLMPVITGNAVAAESPALSSATLVTRPDPMEWSLWCDYMTWLKAEPPAPHPDTLMSRYVDHLISCRIPPWSIGRIMDAIVNVLETQPEECRHIFNNVYRSSAPIYSTQPNLFL